MIPRDAPGELYDSAIMRFGYAHPMLSVPSPLKISGRENHHLKCRIHTPFATATDTEPSTCTPAKAIAPQNVAHAKR